MTSTGQHAKDISFFILKFPELLAIDFPVSDERANLGIREMLPLLEFPIQLLGIGIVLDTDRDVRIRGPTSRPKQLVAIRCHQDPPFETLLEPGLVPVESQIGKRSHRGNRLLGFVLSELLDYLLSFVLLEKESEEREILEPVDDPLPDVLPSIRVCLGLSVLFQPAEILSVCGREDSTGAVFWGYDWVTVPVKCVVGCILDTVE